MGNRRTIGSVAALAACVLCLAPGAQAAEVFLRGDVGISTLRGEASGFNSFAGFLHAGSDRDQSPVYGGALGLAVTLDELVPVRLRIPVFGVPYWPGKELRFGSEDFRLPPWETRLEVEGLAGRDYSLVTPGFTEQVPYRSDLQIWSVMGNFRLDVPVRAPIHALFGRVPILEPLSLYGGAGVGVANSTLETSDSIVAGKESKLNFAYQFSAGVGYSFTERIQWSVGWRYNDFGRVQAPISDGQNDRGELGMSLTSQEITTSLRFNFFHFSLPRVE